MCGSSNARACQHLRIPAGCSGTTWATPNWRREPARSKETSQTNIFEGHIFFLVSLLSSFIFDRFARMTHETVKVLLCTNGYRPQSDVHTRHGYATTGRFCLLFFCSIFLSLHNRESHTLHSVGYSPGGPHVTDRETETAQQSAMEKITNLRLLLLWFLLRVGANGILVSLSRLFVGRR